MEILLSKLKVGDIAKIKNIDGDTHLKRRLYQLGILPDNTVNMLSISPFKNSFIVSVKGYCLAVKKNILDKILVTKL